MKWVTLTVKAHTKDFYERIILVADQQQVRMHDAKVKESIDGLRICPSDFPEAEFFTVHLRESDK